MTEYPDTPDDLYPFAEALVRKMNPPGWDEHRKEDAIQELFLEGWKVYRETKNIGFAKHRMASRKYNLLRDYYSDDTHEPRAETRCVWSEAYEREIDQFEALEILGNVRRLADVLWKARKTGVAA